MSDEKTVAQAKLSAACEAAGIEPGFVYRHWREGGEYVVFTVTLDEESLVPEVHYFSLKYRTRWSRKLTVFAQVMDARTETVRRFERVRRATFDEFMAALGVDVAVIAGTSPRWLFSR